MDDNRFDMGEIDVAWCPGCGNFAIWETLKETLSELEIAPENLVLVSGIGQAAKMPHYVRANVFNGLHGRALPPATAIKAANPGLVVIAESGDGDMYGEGGNHFLHAIRRNPDITNIVHNNMVYGLTKGQASPTSRPGFTTPVQVDGVTGEPFNPLATAIAQNASFVARAFTGHRDQMKEILKAAMSHRGYALVDIFQPCVSFNRLNTFQWFKKNTYPLEEGHDRGNRVEAFRRAIEKDPYPLGIFYVREGVPTFEEGLPPYGKSDLPLYRRVSDRKRLEALVESKRAN